MSADLRQWKTELVFQLAVLLDPVRKLIENPDAVDDEERTGIIARYASDNRHMIEAFIQFARARPGYDFVEHENTISNALGQIVHLLVSNNDVTAEGVHQRIRRVQEVVMGMPVPRTSDILEAHTPFSTYRRLRALCEIEAKQRIIWIDPYLDTDIFYRYLAVVPLSVAITLVTAAPRARASTPDRVRWSAFLGVSQLFAEEYGPEHYRLIVHGDTLHDRWVLFDNTRLYMLGTSVKDAGDKHYFTLAPMEATPKNLETIQVHVDSGEEYFGTSTPTHRDAPPPV